MGALDKFLNIMRLNDDDYDDNDEDIEEEYDDEEDEDLEKPAKSKKEKKGFGSLFKRKSKNDSADDFDDDDYDFDDEEPVREKKPMFKKSSYESQRQTESERSNKIVPVSSRPKSGHSLEVVIIKPAVFNDSCQITDALLQGQAAVINLEGIDTNEAQRIIDFTSGTIYTLKGNIEKISRCIFIVTPEYMNITGNSLKDVMGGAATGSTITAPSFTMKS